MGLAKTPNTTNEPHEQQRRSTIQKSIQDLEQQIQERERTEKERDNAKKSHKNRFLDRQRLMRLWNQKQQQQLNTSKQKKQTMKKELDQLSLDMLYVAHFPHAEMSYQSLYTSNKERYMARGRA